MIAKVFIDSLKTYKEPLYTKDKIASDFPFALANCCRSMKITNILGQPQGLLYDWTRLREFQVNLGIAIESEQYDYLDNIILEFFSEYNYKIITPDGKFVMFKIAFNEDAKNKFVDICNAFKGKEWNNILDDFLDSLYVFLNTITIHGENLEEWH